MGLTACASGPLVIEPKSDHAFSQAFYYAVFSAGLYFLVASLMLVTVWGAYQGKYDKKFQLTMSQRTLMLQTISFLVYLLAGAAVYSHIEGWAYLDALYWADFTLLTIGIGDYSPRHSPWSRPPLSLCNRWDYNPRSRHRLDPVSCSSSAGKSS